MPKDALAYLIYIHVLCTVFWMAAMAESDSKKTDEILQYAIRYA